MEKRTEQTLKVWQRQRAARSKRPNTRMVKGNAATSGTLQGPHLLLTLLGYRDVMPLKERQQALHQYHFTDIHMPRLPIYYPGPGWSHVESATRLQSCALIKKQTFKVLQAQKGTDEIEPIPYIRPPPCETTQHSIVHSKAIDT